MTDGPLHFIAEIRSRDGRAFEEHVRFEAPVADLTLLEMLPSIYMSAGLAITERTGLGPSDLQLCLVRKFGETSEFLVEAQYPRDGGPFADRFRAVDEADAAFQAAQIMAENEAHANGDRGFSYDMLQSIGYMSRCVVHSIEKGPSLEEIKGALLSFWLAHESGDVERIAAVKARTEAIMIKAGMLNDPEQADEEEPEDQIEDDRTTAPGMR